MTYDNTNCGGCCLENPGPAAVSTRRNGRRAGALEQGGNTNVVVQRAPAVRGPLSRSPSRGGRSRGGLERVRRAVDHSLLEVAADQHQADRQAVARAAGYRDRGVTGPPQNGEVLRFMLRATSNIASADAPGAGSGVAFCGVVGISKRS